MGAMNSDGPERDAVSERIIGCAFMVANTLGSGFLEKVYENALALELRAAGFAVERQRPIGVSHKGVTVGDSFVDLLVEGTILIELKTVRALDGAHRAQCINRDERTPPHTARAIAVHRCSSALSLSFCFCLQPPADHGSPRHGGCCYDNLPAVPGHSVFGISAAL